MYLNHDNHQSHQLQQHSQHNFNHTVTNYSHLNQHNHNPQSQYQLQVEDLQLGAQKQQENQLHNTSNNSNLDFLSVNEQSIKKSLSSASLNNLNENNNYINSQTLTSTTAASLNTTNLFSQQIKQTDDNNNNTTNASSNGIDGHQLHFNNSIHNHFQLQHPSRPTIFRMSIYNKYHIISCGIYISFLLL